MYLLKLLRIQNTLITLNFFAVYYSFNRHTIVPALGAIGITTASKAGQIKLFFPSLILYQAMFVWFWRAPLSL
jgi:hypothetical protein